jgi:hypothetical protein
VVFLFIVIILIIISVVKLNSSNKQSSTLLTYSLKTLSFMVLLLITVLTIPFYQAFHSVLVCNTWNPVTKRISCFTSPHVIYFILAIIFSILFIPIGATFVVLFWDINPNSKIPFSGPQNKLNLIKALFKIVLSFLFLFDYKGKYSVYILAAMCFFYLLLLTVRYRKIGYFNKAINSFSCICEVTLFWVSLCVLTHVLFNDGDSDIGLTYMIIEIPFAAYSFLVLIEKKKFSIMKMNLKSLKKDEDVEVYYNIIREFIEMRENDSYRMKLEGMLKYYIKNCSKSENEKLCVELTLDLGREEEVTNKVSKWYLLLKSII